jgi:hypothetical protein
MRYYDARNPYIDIIAALQMQSKAAGGQSLMMHLMLAVAASLIASFVL